MNGEWELKITGVDELNDCDQEHIAKLITEGYTSGEIIQEDDEEEQENEKVRDTDVNELPLLLGSLEFDSSKKILSDKLQEGSVKKK